MRQVRVAVIGTGLWGTAHIRAYLQCAGAELAAVCDIDEGRARQAAEKWGIPNYYTSVDAMLDKEDVEAVSVVTPDTAHARVVVRCAEAGKHVLCEKPLATTVEECEAMIEAAKKNKVFLMVDWHNRWNPPCYEAWRSISEGELGEVRYIYYRLSDTIYVPTRMLPWAGKSSVMLFLGSHSIDTTCWFMGKAPRRVTCRRQEKVLADTGIPTADMYLTVLDFDGGAVAVVENCWVLPQSSPALVDHRVEIIGTKGVIYLNPQRCGAVEKHTELTPRGFPSASLPDMFVVPEVHGRQVGFAVESIYHFVECVRDGKKPVTSGEDGLLNTRIILAAEESADNGAVGVGL